MKKWFVSIFAVGICLTALYLNRNIKPVPKTVIIVTAPAKAISAPATNAEAQSEKMLVNTEGFDTFVQRPKTTETNLVSQPSTSTK